MRILITGSNGLLGQKIVAQCMKRGIPFVATSKGDNRNPDCADSDYRSMDITSEMEVKEVVCSYKPTHIIHTAAMTNVDQCERDPEECRKINTDAVQILFNAAKDIGAHFQLLSTDFVFDGQKGNYREEDPVGPLSHYARSKVDAERILESAGYRNWSIVRTIIVYGTGHNLSRSNIVCWAKDALKKGEKLTIVDDQFRAPTWADDLAWACIRVCEMDATGVFHICGPETMSIYELVCRIAMYYGWSAENITRSSSETLNQPAKRPPRTGFDLSKAEKVLGYAPKTLEQTLDLL